MSDKRVIITGGSSGIGEATAMLFLEKGYHVIILSRNPKRSQLSNKDHVQTYKCDISNKKQVESTFAKIKKTYEKINVLVNNAGINPRTTIDHISKKEFMQNFDINVAGAYMCMVRASKLIKNGAIVNVSSIRGRTGTPSSSVGYSASKAALINLTKSFAIQLAPSIRVNCVAPGAVYPTDMSKDWDVKTQKAIKQETPLQRIGTPNDIAQAIYFLSSDESSFITGHCLDVNGGRFMN